MLFRIFLLFCAGSMVTVHGLVAHLHHTELNSEQHSISHNHANSLQDNLVLALHQDFLLQTNSGTSLSEQGNGHAFAILPIISAEYALAGKTLSPVWQNPFSGIWLLAGVDMLRGPPSPPFYFS